MGKRSHTNLSVEAQAEESREAMNAFYAYESLPYGRIPFDVFGKRARDLKPIDQKRMNRDLAKEYENSVHKPFMEVVAMRTMKAVKDMSA